jgi:hypothetical protein
VQANGRGDKLLSEEEQDWLVLLAVFMLIYYNTWSMLLGLYLHEEEVCIKNEIIDMHFKCVSESGRVEHDHGKVEYGIKYGQT